MKDLSRRSGTTLINISLIISVREGTYNSRGRACGGVPAYTLLDLACRTAQLCRTTVRTVRSSPDVFHRRCHYITLRRLGDGGVVAGQAVLPPLTPVTRGWFPADGAHHATKR